MARNVEPKNLKSFNFTVIQNKRSDTCMIFQRLFKLYFNLHMYEDSHVFVLL